MARIKNPVLFSTHFKVGADKFSKEGLIDPFINVDTQLFIDPILLEQSSNSIIRVQALKQFQNHFSNFVRLLAISANPGDAPWKAAARLLDLHEPAENGLGYGGSGRSGSSRPDKIRDAILKTSSEIITLGVQDPEMISLMGFFEENVGPDTISDFTTRVITEQLSEITQNFCKANNIATFQSPISAKFTLPKITKSSGKEAFFLLVPIDIVRELPIANDWSDIEKAAFQNVKIRDHVNSFLARITTPTIAQKKAALRNVATLSADLFHLFLNTVKEHAKSYDTNKDALGYYNLKAILAGQLDAFRLTASHDVSTNPKALFNFVNATIEHFKHHVEKGNLWENLWIDDKPKKERAAQLTYFAIADCFCKANNIDISPEADMGGGPVDFKFSKGYNARVLVELKRSTGTVVHGYTKQLEIYKDAARTQYGIFVIMDYGKLGSKLRKIQALRDLRISRGEPASEIIVIECKKKASASVRKN